ncbi:hypothetical protein NQ176_g4237 [Zarea fungicola]|uniref:Uncharacterized protein n=1 Tax=Zarea fungicola TaxID=93591 RepID=A0ACC1NEG8_9HYPO|nr:hypothetical protein NQ176_g4237 [Lecanicillium fungicola]
MILSHALITCFSGCVAALESLTIVPQFARSNAAAPLPNNLIGFSIKSDRWNDWTGRLSDPNKYTYTLLDNLKQKTGVASPIRVGGDTEDRLSWSEDVDGVNNIFPAVPDVITATKQLFPEASHGKIGGDWFYLSRNLPEGTAIIWGVNFAANSVTEALTQDESLQSVTLESIEIGNEVDYWGGLYRPKNWTMSAYVDQYNDFVEEINKSIGPDGLRYQIGAFSGVWDSTQIGKTDLFQSQLGKVAQSFSDHHYNNVADFTTRPESEWPSLRAQLITKSNIRNNLTAFGPKAKFFHEHKLHYYLGETNSMFGHGMPGVSNSAAASLWAIDYVLQAATLGVDTVYLHSGVGYNYSAFQPIDHLGKNITDYSPSATRHITPLYMGVMVLSDIIGKHTSTWINELQTGNDHLAAYLIFEDSRLARVVLINSEAWEGDELTPRPGITVYISGIDPSEAKLKRLSPPNLGTTSGILWGSQSWESDSGDVMASSAVVIFL